MHRKSKLEAGTCIDVLISIVISVLQSKSNFQSFLSQTMYYIFLIKGRGICTKMLTVKKKHQTPPKIEEDTKTLKLPMQC